MSGDRLRIVAHELRSPVAALVAFAEQAAARSLPASVLRSVAALAAAAGGDIERLLADPELVSVRPEHAELYDTLAVLVRPGVALSGDAVVVQCDPTRIRQAVGNLVTNGLRHGTSVAIDVRRNEQWAEVVVRDDGPGVAPGYDLFARGVSRTGSTGFGLWLARAIAEAHGGRLELDARDGRPGATFRLSLPLSADAPG